MTSSRRRVAGLHRGGPHPAVTYGKTSATVASGQAAVISPALKPIEPGPNSDAAPVNSWPHDRIRACKQSHHRGRCPGAGGSTNFDDRSFRLNEEANLNIYDAAFAAEQVKAFEEDKGKPR